jgi:hypothetical protein
MFNKMFLNNIYILTNFFLPSITKVLVVIWLFFQNFKEPNSSIGLVDSVATVFYSFIAQDIPREPRSVSGRILVLSVCINGGVLFWSYSAGLVSFLTVEKYEYPIKTLNVSLKLLNNFMAKT